MTSARRGRTPRSTQGPAYWVMAPNPRNHAFEVRLRIARPQAVQRLSLPVWIPGSYLIREFARHLHGVEARQGGSMCTVRPLDKASWEITCDASLPLDIRYRVHAFDQSVRAAHLDAERGFFNGTSLFLRVHGQESRPHTLTLSASDFPRAWKLATELPATAVTARGFGRYMASDYDELVDSPVELGCFWEGRFEARGVPHRMVIAGAGPGLDTERLIADVRALCEAQIRFWHGRGRPPHASYTFLLHAVESGYGGLEHRNSTALIAARRDLPRLGDERRSEGYVTLLGLISHEYFHTWNVKRLRPSEFLRYDYAQEQDTRLLWFFEGFTSYFDELFLRRAQLVDDATYLRLITKTINQVLQTPGRRVQSVERAAADAWIKYYRPDEATPNLTVSYYAKGALIALCLDLRLRALGASLDEVMRLLWKRCLSRGMDRSDLHAALARCGADGLAAELDAWVDGTADLPVADLLRAQGADCVSDDAPLSHRLGIRLMDGAPLTLKTVLAGSAAEAAGLCPNDELLALEVDGTVWQLRRLDDLSAYAGHLLTPQGRLPAKRRPSQADVKALRLWVARDRRVHQLALVAPLPTHSVQRVTIRDTNRLREWLEPR